VRRIVSLSWIALGTIGCSYPPLSASLPFCIGSRPKVCLPDAPTATVTLNQDTEIDTDHRTDSLLECDGDNDQMGFCVIAAQSITITSAAKLRAFGRRPLVLLASGMIDIQGTIDVSSTSAAATMDAGAGAGADPTTCRTAAAPMAGGCRGVTSRSTNWLATATGSCRRRRLVRIHGAAASATSANARIGMVAAPLALIGMAKNRKPNGGSTERCARFSTIKMSLSSRQV